MTNDDFFAQLIINADLNALRAASASAARAAAEDLKPLVDKLLDAKRPSPDIDCRCTLRADKLSVTTTFSGAALCISSTPGTNSTGEVIKTIEIISNGDDYSFTLVGRAEIADFRTAMLALLA